MTPDSSYRTLHDAFGEAATGSYIFDRAQLLAQVTHLLQHQPAAAAEIVAQCDALLEGRVEMPYHGAKAVNDDRPLHQIQPRLSFLAYLPWATAISGDTRYDAFACEAFAAWYAECGEYNALTPAGKRAVLRGPGHGLMLESLCRFHQAVDPAIMPDDLRTRLQLAMVQHADVLYREHLALTYSNVYAFKLLGVLSVSVTLPQWRDGQSWRADVVTELKRCLAAQFRPDGGHVEQSPNYTRAVLHIFAIFFRLCEANSITIDAELHDLYRRAGLAHWNVNIGNGESLPLGDSDQRNLHYGMAWWALGLPRGEGYQIEHHCHPDWVIAGLGQHFQALADCPPLPPLRSVTLPDTGYTFIRPPGESATVMVIDTGPHGYYHGHYDLLSVVLYHDGQAILPDPGNHAYDSSAMRQACLSTYWHSAPCLDMENHHAWDDGETPLAHVEAWEVAVNGECFLSAWHDGYANWTGAPRIHRTVWYDGNDIWVIIDQLTCQKPERRERPYAFISTYNLPTTDITVADDFSSVRTHNAIIMLANPDRIDHINLLPGRYTTGAGSATGKRLALVTNGEAACHIAVIHPCSEKPRDLNLQTLMSRVLAAQPVPLLNLS